jgi:hypothetical protein
MRCWFSSFPNIDNPPILNIKFGAGAARSILVEPEPETQQDAAQALAPALTIQLIRNQDEKIYPNLISTCLLFCVQYALLLTDGNNVWEEGKPVCV